MAPHNSMSNSSVKEKLTRDVMPCSGTGVDTDQRNAVSNKLWLQVSRQGPWDEDKDQVSLAGAPSLPMPVKIASKQSLAPFLAHLSANGSHRPLSDANDVQLGSEPYYGVDLIEYPKGVLYSDGRMDLCKMVVGPTHIQSLLDSLRANTFAKHFLLGNNIIGALVAQAIASFVDEFPDRFETWYLAGDCVNNDSLSLLVDSWKNSTAITNVWLKRNPLGTRSAQCLTQLICQSPNLRTLDLDQTELGDRGVGDVFAALAQCKSPSLRHVYLNATGINEYACQQISYFLASPACNLESLYMSCNPVGNNITYLARGLKSNCTLQRLSIRSCGLKSASVSYLYEALSGHKSLKVLDLGQAYATKDLGARYNWIADSSLPQLTHLIRTTKLQYLDLGEVAMTQNAINELTNTVTQSSSMLYFVAKSIHRDAISAKLKRKTTFLQKLCKDHLASNVKDMFDCSYDHFLAEHKRFVLSPQDVRLIDSVYRNRDAGLARRGLRILDKHWEDGDDTALRSELGTL